MMSILLVAGFLTAVLAAPLDTPVATNGPNNIGNEHLATFTSYPWPTTSPTFEECFSEPFGGAFDPRPPEPLSGVVCEPPQGTVSQPCSTVVGPCASLMTSLWPAIGRFNVETPDPVNNPVTATSPESLDAITSSFHTTSGTGAGTDPAYPNALFPKPAGAPKSSSIRPGFFGPRGPVQATMSTSSLSSKSSVKKHHHKPTSKVQHDPRQEVECLDDPNCWPPTLETRRACPLKDISCLPLPPMRTIDWPDHRGCPGGTTSCGPITLSPPPTGIQNVPAITQKPQDTCQFGERDCGLHNRQDAGAATSAAVAQFADGGAYNPPALLAEDSSGDVVEPEVVIGTGVSFHLERNCSNRLHPSCFPTRDEELEQTSDMLPERNCDLYPPPLCLPHGRPQ